MTTEFPFPPEAPLAAERAATHRDGASALDAAPVVAPGPAATSAPGASEKPIGRRAMLSVLGLGALGTLFGAHVQAGISGLLRSVHAGGLASVLPGGGQFTIYTVTSGYPAAPADYRLRVGGLVERPLSLSVGDLQSLPATHLTRDFQCVTGWVVSNVHWVGVRLADLADHAGVKPAARAFRLTSFDGVYTESLTLEQARQTGALVAYSMLGAPITREHGGPVRLYVPDMFGYKAIKWLSGIELVTQAAPGYWEQNGYPVDAWIGGQPPAASKV
ncbi:MAG TPA: molybdopterin-dependent oxidoreductase [Solirubrobacteraceae bacterium]|nr:molybdopterin-dependent oxidoreductase [Solirubrobacteraceae bacterium]